MEESLIRIGELSWTEVLSRWREGEASLPRWIEHYMNRGFGSWDEWRANTVHDLHGDKLAWELFEAQDPSVVADFFAGPFRAWQKKYYAGPRMLRFKDLVQDPALRKEAIVREMMERFPQEVFLVTLRTPEGIVVIEGMHRACALAIMDAEGRLPKTRITVALASFPGELPDMGQTDSPT